MWLLLSCSGRHFYRLIGVLALVGQLAMGSMPPPDEAARSQLQALNAVGVLCQGSRHASDDSHNRPHRHGSPALCLLADAAGLPAALPVPGPMLPAPQRHLAGRRLLPLGARAPPSRGVQSGYPRGPPPIPA